MGSRQPAGRGRELDYLLASCLGGPRPLPVPDGGFDWEALRALSTRHRVDGLVWRALQVQAPEGSAAPAHVVADLDRSRRAQSFAYLGQLAETQRLSALLEASGCRVIALKGVTLASLLYRPDPGLRQAADIDLLVAPEDFARADGLLASQGYERQTPAATMPASADSMARHLCNAFEFYDAARGMKVELHHRLLRDPHLMPVPFDDLVARASHVATGGSTLRCLGPGDLGVYLCCHAAEDAFFRLKWLVDIARLVDLSADQGRAMLARSRELKAERHVILSLLMLELLTGRPMPATLENWRQSLLPLAEGARLAIERRDRGSARYGFADIPDDLRQLAYSLRLSQGTPSRGFKALQFLCNHEDLSTLKLGVEWRLLYALLGRPLALRRWLGRAFSRQRTETA